MKTKKITLFYQITKDKVIPPNPVAIERKDEWLKGIQNEVGRGSKRMVRVTYEIFNPEIGRILKFFNGPVIEYYAIQNEDMTEGRPGRPLIDRYREQLLDDALGYDVPLIDRTVRRRTSTGTFLSTQKWHDFLETLRETHFEPQGYEFPDSEKFWDVETKEGYERAHEISIKQLQDRLKRKLSPRQPVADTEITE